MTTGSEPSSAHPDSVARLLRTRVEAEPIALPVSGSSMAGVIETGAEVRVSGAAVPRPGEIWAFVDDDGRIVVHRVRHLFEETVICRGTGNIFDDDPVPRSRLVGRVRTATTQTTTRTFGEIDRARANLVFRTRRVVRRGLDWLPKRTQN